MVRFPERRRDAMPLRIRAMRSNPRQPVFGVQPAERTEYSEEMDHVPEDDVKQHSRSRKCNDHRSSNPPRKIRFSVLARSRSSLFHDRAYGLAKRTECQEPPALADDASNSIERQRLRRLEVGIAMSVSEVFCGPSIYREQLFLSFFSKASGFEALTARYAMKTELWDWFNAPGQATREATNSLLLAQFAYDTNSETCRRAAQLHYGKGIRALRLALTTSSGSADAFSATDALGVCEMYPEVTGGVNAWGQHARGLCAILHSRGLSWLEAATTGGRSQLVFDAIYVGLTDAVYSRKSFLFSDPPWRRAIERACCGRLWCYLHIGSELPALLEWLDKLDTAKTPVKESELLLTKLMSTQARLQEWVLAWYEENPALIIRRVSVSNYPWYVSCLGTMAETFPTVLTLPSFQIVRGQYAYWTLMLVIRVAIHDLSTRPSAVSLMSERQRQQVRDGAYECADAICEAVPSYLESIHHTEKSRQDGVRGNGFAAEWYGEHEARPKFEFRKALLTGSGSWGIGLGFVAEWYAKQKDWPKHEFCKVLLSRQHDSPSECGTLAMMDNEPDRSMHGPNFLFFRRLWQNCIGPERCILERSRRRKADVEALTKTLGGQITVEATE